MLAKLTTNRFKGALTGAFVTGVLNSSTVTTLLVVGFISGGLMTLTQSVGVIIRCYGRHRYRDGTGKCWPPSTRP